MSATPAFADRGALDAPGPAAVLVDGAGSDPAVDDVLTPEVLTLVGTMSLVHDHARRALLDARAARAADLRAGALLQLDPSTDGSARVTGPSPPPPPTSRIDGSRSPDRSTAR